MQLHMEHLTPATIRQRATRALVTMDALFARAGIPASTFWRWERGDHEPRPLTVEKLRQALEAIEGEKAE
jgi:transcriptional regulator with XRE-family HTH domain